MQVGSFDWRHVRLGWDSGRWSVDVRDDRGTERIRSLALPSLPAVPPVCAVPGDVAALACALLGRRGSERLPNPPLVGGFGLFRLHVVQRGHTTVRGGAAAELSVPVVLSGRRLPLW